MATLHGQEWEAGQLGAGRRKKESRRLGRLSVGMEGEGETSKPNRR